MLPRILIAGVLLIVAWYVVSFIAGFFDGSIGKRSSVLLTTASDSIEVALQGEDWQRATSGIKLYAGDKVASRSASDGVLRFFDRTGVRLDQSTELTIDNSDLKAEADSKVALTLVRGRLWILTPTTTVFSGSIVRTVDTEYATITVPSGVSALISPELVHVVSSDGQGLTVTFTQGEAKNESIIVGEGQYLSLNAENRASLEDGADPYSLRDPATTELLRDPFVAGSLALLAKETVVTDTTEDVPVISTDDVIVDAPENNVSLPEQAVTVRGRVSDRVALLLIQGQAVTVDASNAFSADIRLEPGASTVIRIEGQDAQGIPLSTIERTVRSTWSAVVEPVRINAPVGSGGTFIATSNEVEIAGEAPANTAAIRVNDYTLQLFSPGARTWSYLASTGLGNLKPGENIFTVYAVDQNGNLSPGRSITVQLDTSATASSAPPIKQNPPIEPGTLTVTEPVAGTEGTVTENDVLIEGNTSPNTASISVNGYTLSLYLAGKTTWNYIANTEFQTLKRGRNVYRIVSRNASGEILDVLEYVLTFNP